MMYYTTHNTITLFTEHYKYCSSIQFDGGAKQGKTTGSRNDGFSIDILSYTSELKKGTHLFLQPLSVFVAIIRNGLKGNSMRVLCERFLMFLVPIPQL